jgi:hypothetical protein
MLTSSFTYTLNERLWQVQLHEYKTGVRCGTSTITARVSFEVTVGSGRYAERMKITAVAQSKVTDYSTSETGLGLVHYNMERVGLHSWSSTSRPIFQ